MTCKFVYCESQDGGMATHEYSDYTKVRGLYGWMDADVKAEDEVLVSWMKNATPGTFMHHRLGVCFCVYSNGEYVP